MQQTLIDAQHYTTDEAGPIQSDPTPYFYTPIPIHISKQLARTKTALPS
jgi:hypothetical protein